MTVFHLLIVILFVVLRVCVCLCVCRVSSSVMAPRDAVDSAGTGTGT